MRGLLSNKDYLMELIGSLKVQVFALTETHANKDLDYKIPGFNFVSKPRQNRSGRGKGRNIPTKSLNLGETI